MGAQPMADQTSSGQNIDQIRDLIFGEQIQKYDRRFKELAQEGKKLNGLIDEMLQKLVAESDKQKADLEQKINEVKKDFQKIQANLQQAVKEIGNLKSSIDGLQSDKVDRIQIANLLIDLGMRLKGENILDSISIEGDEASDG